MNTYYKFLQMLQWIWKQSPAQGDGSEPMNSKQSIATVKRYIYLMNAFLCLVRIGMLTFFAIMRIHAMVYVNICSVLCCAISFFLIKKELISPYILTAFIEILAHSFFAVLFLGCASDFYLYFFACIAIILFSEYFSAHIGIKHIYGIQLSFVCAVLLIISLLMDRFIAPRYEMSAAVTFGCRIFNSVSVLGIILLFFGMLTKIASSYEQDLAAQATHDNLTGLWNRHYLTEYMNKIHKTTDLKNYWLAILDIDDFKKINDTYGHLCGDFVLRNVAETLKELCGGRIVCRWGGEEFMIVGEHSGRTSAYGNGVGLLLEDIRRNIASREFTYGAGTTLHLTVTIGAAFYEDSENLDAWVNTADELLYAGKQMGKNTVVGAEF